MQPDALTEVPADSPAAMTRPFFWSVRRELWENRSIYIAPLAVAALGLCGFLLSLARKVSPETGMASFDPAYRPLQLAMPYTHAAMLIAITAFIVGFFYCLEALHSERRDRSILFWKSLPVSDRTTVLAKASIPLVVLPVLVFTIVIALQWSMLLLSTAALLLRGGSAAMLWKQLPLVQLEVESLYSLIVIALWHAPLYGWLLLVSGWARRTTFLWAVLPPLAVALVEFITFGSTHFGSLLVQRLVGFATVAYNMKMPDGTPVDAHFIPVSQLAPRSFLSTPGLWIGLVVAALFIAAAVRLRRDREAL